MKPWNVLIDLLYPRRANCMGCDCRLGCAQNDLCEDCRAALAKNWVGAVRCKAAWKLDGAAVAHPYRGAAGRIVRHMKFGGAAVLADGMGEELARAAEQLRLKNVDFVTAVPMHPSRERARGRNHAEYLAKRAAERLNLAYMPVLLRTRNAPQQARLKGNARRQNLKNGFAVRPEMAQRVQNARVLLVDDVLTTGSTAAACADALRKAGAQRVWFVGYAIGEGNGNG